ncbi:MAG TPA: ferredoxin family protein [Planctomycetes bacterium]|nr:ferredoxin family protein [Planctomycetota bacterium]
MILYCNCAYSQVIPDGVKANLREQLTDSGVEFEAVPDLCELSARRDPVLRRWAGMENLKIIACFERAVKWLFHAAGAPLPAQGVEFFNMKTDSVEDILESLSKYEKSQKSHQKLRLDKTSEWIPWFPVIDYDRCANCKQCLNFCLFGVFGLSEQGQVQVQKPANCKTNCPACARVCPQKAIIFPKYTESPFNGDRIGPDAGHRTDTGTRLSELLGADIHDVLRGRGKIQSFSQKKGSGHEVSRFSKLQNELDIPQEVIDSLTGAQENSDNPLKESQGRPDSIPNQCDCRCKREERR